MMVAMQFTCDFDVAVGASLRFCDGDLVLALPQPCQPSPPLPTQADVGPPSSGSGWFTLRTTCRGQC